MSVLTHFRYAARLLTKNPGFSSVAILTLALGIGLNVTVFSILNVLLFKPASVQHAAELVWVTGTSPDGGRFRVLSHAYLLDLGAATSAVRSVAGIADARVAVRAGSQSLRVRSQIVTGNYFEVLGVRAGAGRALDARDDQRNGNQPVAMLGDVTAGRLFGSAADAVDKMLEINGKHSRSSA